MTKKVLNFIEINKRSGWHHLGDERVSSWISSLLVIGMGVTS